jgi:hypothetical protein
VSSAEDIDARRRLLRAVRRYLVLLIEREWVRRTGGADETLRVKRWDWVAMGWISKDKENAYVLSEVQPWREVFGGWSKPGSFGAWAALEAVSENYAAGSKSREAEVLRAFCSRHPAQVRSRFVAVSRREYLEALCAAANIASDVVARHSQRFRIPVPWGQGNPRIPNTAREFDRICGRLRDRYPNPEDGVVDILRNMDLPPVPPGGGKGAVTKKGAVTGEEAKPAGTHEDEAAPQAPKAEGSTPQVVPSDVRASTPGKPANGLARGDILWYEGQRYEFQHISWLILEFMWGKDSAQETDLTEHVWGDPVVPTGTLKGALSRLNTSLLEYKLPFRFRRKQGDILRHTF